MGDISLLLWGLFLIHCRHLGWEAELYGPLYLSNLEQEFGVLEGKLGLQYVNKQEETLKSACIKLCLEQYS